jgi:LytS/YehU family sensor histidine kinase
MHGAVKTSIALVPEHESFWSWRTLAYWTGQVLGWSAYYWSQASGEAIFASVPWHKAQTLWGIVAVTNLVLTHAIRVVAKHYAWIALPPRKLVWRVLAATAIASALSVGVIVTTSLSIYGTSVAPLFLSFYQKLPHSTQLFNQAVATILMVLIWVSTYFAIVIQRQRHRDELRQAQLSEALQAAELRLLKSQLNPHFLFNSLNGVRALIADEPAKAQDAVTQLARTLRYTLASGDADLVTLAREMEMVGDYLALESMRLAERLTVVREIEPGAADARIPVMLLQTLVENAIKHGIAPLRQGGTLRISGRVVEQVLILSVENPRPHGSSVTPYSNGVGLKNSSERLRLLFGTEASLELDLSSAQRAIATVRLPA